MRNLLIAVVVCLLSRVPNVNSSDAFMGLPSFTPHSCVGSIASNDVTQAYCHRVIRLFETFSMVRRGDNETKLSIIASLNSALASEHDQETLFHYNLTAAHYSIQVRSRDVASALLLALPSWNSTASQYAYILKVLQDSLNVRLGIPLSNDSDVHDVASSVSQLLNEIEDPLFASALMSSANSLSHHYVDSQNYIAALSMMDACRDAVFLEESPIRISMCYSSFLDREAIPIAYRHQIAQKLFDLVCGNGAIPALCKALNHKFQRYNIR